MDSPVPSGNVPFDVQAVSEGVRVANTAPRAVNLSKYSSWFMTISTNVKPIDEADSMELGQKLDNALAIMFSKTSLEPWRRIITFRNKKSNDGFDKFDSVDVRWVVERGRKKRGGRIHAHVILRIKHRTSIHLNYKEVRAFMIELLNDDRITNIYFNAKPAGTNQSLEDYLAKEGIVVGPQDGQL